MQFWRLWLWLYVHHLLLASITVCAQVSFSSVWVRVCQRKVEGGETWPSLHRGQQTCTRCSCGAGGFYKCCCQMALQALEVALQQPLKKVRTNKGITDQTILKRALLIWKWAQRTMHLHVHIWNRLLLWWQPPKLSVEMHCCESVSA